MSCDASDRVDNKEREKYFLWLKKRTKIEKKVNEKMKQLRVAYLNIFVFVFPVEIKMRGVYVGGNARKRV